MKFLTLLIFLLSGVSLFAQKINHNNPDEYKHLPQGSVVYKFMDGDSVSHTRIEQPDSLKRYIIEFTEPALYAQTVNSNLKSAQLLEEKLQTIDRQHEQFEHDLNQMFNRGNGNLKSQSTEKKVLSQSYRKVFNGVAIQVNSMVIEELKRKPYVKKVYSDKLVQAIDDESNQVIKADSVRQQYGVTGKGVVIGIIDTGIDYNHPDLSNGKVIGGYDFVNEDDDPMDDHGHGTHCAGIAAANGPGLTGVAPDAKLMAVKVLDEWGNGWDSDIIAGIEYAVDPDGNPATDDGADIISMSLGGSGNPDDPMSAAVDNAFNKGVLSIVAAGNNGAFFSIGSPGCAKEALTVGASDNIGERAFFSSAGPVMMSYALKPNVLAPGVDIYSSVPGGNYESWNGTSMATPHVAGAAALLKEFHLSWDAKMLRSSIIHTAAYNSEYLVWHQGNGCVDLMKAAQCVSFVSKSSCDFGIIPIEEEMVSLKDSFFVKNQYQTNLNYHVQYNREPPFGLARNILPSTFTLAPGDSQLVVITLQIENSKLAFSDNAVKSYSGEILIDDAIQPLSIHYTFIKSYYVKLTFDFDPWLVLIHDGKSFSKEFFPDSRTYIVLVDSGLYDVLSFDTECYIVKENVPVYESVNLNFSRSEANNRVKIEGIDPYGQPVKLWDNGAEMLYRKSTNTRLAVSTFKMRYWDGKTDMPVYKYFSDFSDKYRFEVAPTVHQEANPERKRYNIPYLINNGLYGDTILVNQSDNFVTMNFTYHNIDESNDSVYYDDEDYNGGYGLVYIFNNFNVLDNVLTSPYRRVAYYVPSPDRDYRVCSRFGNCLFKYNGNGILDPWTDTLLFKSTDQNRCFWDNGKIKLVTSEDGFEKEVGKFIDIDFNMSPKICKSPINLDFNQYANTLYKRDKHFSGSDFGIVPAPFKVELFKENQLVSTDSLMNDIYTYYNEKFIIPYDAYTNYKLRIESPMYSIQGKVGRSYATFYYNRNEYIYTSDLLPRLLNFGLESDGRATTLFDPKGENALALSYSARLFDKIKVAIKTNSSGTWSTIIDFTPGIGNLSTIHYSLPLELDLTRGYYDLKLTFISSENDSTEYVLEPAFQVVDALTTDSLRLIDLYFATDGANWKNKQNWLQGPLHTWHGVTLGNNRVTELRLPDNNLKFSLPQNFSKLSELKVLHLQDNMLTGLNDLTGITGLVDGNVANNKLTFEDLISCAGMEHLSYSPQQQNEGVQTINTFEGTRISFSAPLQETGTHYFWYKDQKLLAQTDTATLVLTNVSYADSGIYMCFMLNEFVPGLTLRSDKFLLGVKPQLFRDVSAQVTAFREGANTLAWCDFDIDGDQDLFLAKDHGNNVLMRNKLFEQDTLLFEDVTDEFLVNQGFGSSGGIWGDIDNNGFPDLLIANNSEEHPNQLFLNNGNGTFLESIIPGLFEKNNDAGILNLFDVNNDSKLDVYAISLNPFYDMETWKNQFYLAQPDGSFSTNYLTDFFELHYSYRNTWFDYSNDGKIDVFFVDGAVTPFRNLTNSFSIEDFSFYNNYGKDAPVSSDFNNDGYLDLFIGCTGSTWLNEPISHSLLKNISGKTMIHLNNTLTRDSMDINSACWGDYDNDGDLDLICLSEFGDFVLWINLLQEQGIEDFKRYNLDEFYTPFRNAKACTFVDYDNDGDLDFSMAADNQCYLFENLVGSSNNWIEMSLKGTLSNSSAYGTKVKVKANINGRDCWQTREVTSLVNRTTSSPSVTMFGLGNATVIDSVKIYWPSGTYWDTTNVQINQFIEFVEHEKPNDLPQMIALNDTIIFENVPFSKTYNIKDDWNKGINMTVSKLPSWLKFQYNNRLLNLSGLPNDYSPGDYQLIFSVDDGYVIKPVVDTLNIQVVNVNDPPIIFGQGKIEMPENGVLILEIGMMQCFDIDNFLSELSVRIHDGNGYTVRADSILLNQNYFYNLSVPIQLFDGELYSDTFDLEIINNLNDIPYLSITDHHLYAVEDEYFETEIQVVDSRFSKIEVAELNHLGWLSCTLKNQTIKLSGTPENNDTGFYTYVLELDDGYLENPIKDTLFITVENVNDAPVITGQHPASFDVDGRFDFSLDYLQVEDVDNEYPMDFGFSMQAGNNYRLEGNSIFYTNTDNSLVELPIQVHDGFLHSNTWNFTIEKASNSTELLNEQIELYPIPFVNELHLVVPNGLKVNSFSFYNVTGQRVYPEIIIDNHHYLIDFTGCSQEFILMNIVLNEKVITKKLMRIPN